MKSLHQLLINHGVLPSLITQASMSDLELYCRQAECGTEEFLRFADICDDFSNEVSASIEKAKAQALNGLAFAIKIIESHTTKVASTLFSSFKSGEKDTQERHLKLAAALEAPILGLGGIKRLCVPESSRLHALSIELVLRRIAISEMLGDTALTARYNALSSQFTSLGTQKEQRLTRLSSLTDTAIYRLKSLLTDAENAVSLGGNLNALFDNLLVKYLTALHDLQLLIREI